MKNVALRLKNKIVSIIGKTFNTIQLLYFKKGEYIVVNAWMTLYGNKANNRNWGDELNYYLIRELSGKKIFNYSDLYVRKEANVCCIGSIVDDMANENSLIWGTGAISDKRKMRCIPKKVYAVRGPLTRKYLISNGIDCPEIYGDPALLLSRIYNPLKTKKYTIGIIPHYVDYNNPLVERLKQLFGIDAVVISMSGYNDWHEVIDIISECDFVVSSSLHGIIISDAYRVPNVWIEFSDNVTGNGFKFRDYFLSVGREEIEPIHVTKDTSKQELLSCKDEWKPIDINLDKLLSVCPFHIRKKYMPKVK